MKPHEKLGVAIADAGYDWTPEMRSAWEELDRQQEALSRSGNNAQDVGNTKQTLPKGKE